MADYLAALQGKKIPILILDQKWHRLFAIHGKPDEVKELETKLNGLLAKQGKLTNDLKEYKRLKSKLMDSIVHNMDDTNGELDQASREKSMEDDRNMIDELNERIEQAEQELLELPDEIKAVNQELMLKSMDYFYDKLKVNASESKEIEEWIAQVRIDLKKNIIRKQNRDINNREIYAYLHDILGPEVLDLFDIAYDTNLSQSTKTEEGN